MRSRRDVSSLMHPLKMTSIFRALCLLLLLFVFAAPGASAERPQCAAVNMDRPGACFFDDMGSVGAVRWEINGDAYVAVWPGDDFFQARPDGTLFGMATTQDTRLFVCPESAGGRDCAFAFLGMNPGLFDGAPVSLLPGMLSGTGGHLDNVGVFSGSGGFSCPNVLHVKGTVLDEFGTEFEFADYFHRLTAPGDQLSCLTKDNEITIELR